MCVYIYIYIHTHNMSMSCFLFHCIYRDQCLLFISHCLYLWPYIVYIYLLAGQNWSLDFVLYYWRRKRALLLVWMQTFSIIIMYGNCHTWRIIIRHSNFKYAKNRENFSLKIRCVPHPVIWRQECEGYKSNIKETIIISLCVITCWFKHRCTCIHTS